jgi:periplasmic protein TonB
MRRQVTHESSRPADPERLSRAVWASIGLHAGLAVLLIASPALFPANGELWGSDGGSGGAISFQTVQDLSGLPLAPAPNARPDAIGNDLAGLNEPVPQPEAAAPAEAPEDAEPVPENFEVAEEAPSEPEPAPTPPPPPPKPEPTPPAPRLPEPPRDPVAPPSDNAIPVGGGGRPDVSGSFGNGQGTGALEVGDGAFGTQYGTYVNAMRQKISNNWYESMVDASVPPGSRVTLTFDILRNGNIDALRIVESSGSRSLDTSAQRAILRSSPLGALPATFRGSRISVRFWFEFRR